MKTIHLDKEFHCYTEAGPTTVQSVETDFFDGKCAAYIEGHRFVPYGQSYTAEDGTVYVGGMISPWKPDAELSAAQDQYERDQAELSSAYQEGVNSI